MSKNIYVFINIRERDIFKIEWQSKRVAHNTLRRYGSLHDFNDNAFRGYGFLA